MRRLPLILSEIRHQSKVFWRVPISAFFTVAFPLMFLLLFNTLNTGVTLDQLGGLPFAQFFTPAIAVFAMVTAGYTNLAISMSIDRDEGVLKRVRGTPVPPAVYMAGRIGAAVVTGFISVILMLVIGVSFFGVDPVWDRVPLSLLILALGAATFSALGLAVAGAAPNGQAAPAIANATILPLTFISGIFFPLEGAPSWLRTVSGLFPLRPFAEAFGDQWNPLAFPAFPWRSLAIMALWLVIGVVVASRTFTWDPRPGGRRRGARAES